MRFVLNRIGERLWVKPLLMCLVSIIGVFLARSADYYALGEFVPDISAESVQGLLSIISTSMLAIATFAVASMVSAYASASRTATPRSFPLIIADDVSQNALSAFVGAFIFSIVAQIAMDNSYYEKTGRFALFVLTLLVFTIVIVTFVRWVDRVARLGRLGSTIDKVEAATANALKQRRAAPTLGGLASPHRPAFAQAVYSSSIGYVQQVDIAGLQKLAEESHAQIEVTALPGTFAAPGRALARVSGDTARPLQLDLQAVAQQFLIGDDRTFDEDPRFGLIVLSEIASRALSPGTNDPGTAINVIGTLVRLFVLWKKPETDDNPTPAKYNRVAVPTIALADMFDDAFSAIARDGAGNIEVVVRLQKAFESLSQTDDPALRSTATQFAQLALARAEMALTFPRDLETARHVSKFATSQVVRSR